MAHYAFLNKDNIVTEVITGVNETELIDDKSPEEWYGEFRNQTCKRTSYNTNANQHKDGGTPFRGNYAGIGFKYDERFDVFIAPQPFPSWKLNYTNYTWEAPTPMPDYIEDSWWKWSEYNKEWIKVDF